jgi:hypothetical protein
MRPAPAYAVPIVVPLGRIAVIFCRAYYKPCLKADLLQFRGNHELRQFRIIVDVKQVGLAANLAIFHVALFPSGGFVHRGLIPLTAGCALETGVHKRLTA